MLTIQTTKDLYFFDELDQAAQDNAARFEIECMFSDDMNCLIEDVALDFPNSEIEAQYDYSYTQGSGLNLYGKFALNDLVHYATGHYLDHDEADAVIVKLTSNHHYNYCLWDVTYHAIIEAALTDYFEEFGPESDTIEELTEAITDKMLDLCDAIYTQGETVLEGYYEPERYECMLFDEFGQWEGHTWDYPEARYTSAEDDGPDNMTEAA